MTHLIRFTRRRLKSCLLAGCFVAVPLLAHGLPALATPSAKKAASPLSLHSKIELPSFEGDYDRLGTDQAARTLFVAGEDSNKVELIDLKSNHHLGSIDLPTPHYIVALPRSNEVLITHTGGDGQSVIVSGTTRKIVGSMTHRRGANSMAVDVLRNRIYMIAGGKNSDETDSSLIEIDAARRVVVGELKLPVEKVQALAVEERGRRVFTNLTSLKKVAVIDKVSRTMTATWPVDAQGDNGLLALDEASGHLFVGMRKPDSLVVLDTATGAKIATLALPGSCDNLIFDDRNKRLYALGGEGRIAVYHRDRGGRYVELPSIPSEPGGKTGLLLPAAGKLLVAISPGATGRAGALLTYKVND